MKGKAFMPTEHNSELDYLEFFTTPFHLIDEKDQELLQELPENAYDHVVVIGRFQPLHYGHVYLIKQAAKMAKKITIGIGSANIKDEDNPFTAEQRLYMLRKAMTREGLTDQIKQFVFLDDNPDDNIWINQTLEKIGTVEAVVGNNDWVNSCFKSVGLASQEVPLLQRGIYEGRKIREFLRKVDKLK